MNILNNSELNKLIHIERTLETNIRNIMEKLNENLKCFRTEIVDVYSEINQSRNSELNDLKNEFQKIASSLKMKINLLRNRQFEEIKDFKMFKKEMIDIQENILNFKRKLKMNLDNLEQLETDLSEELDFFYNSKVSIWSASTRINSKFDVKVVIPKVKSKNQEICKEVKQFLDFINRSGGHENGWKKDDHLLFLKYKKKYNNVDDIAINLHDTLPDITIEDIKHHYEWYLKYLELNSRKKQAIKQWKQNKFDIKKSKNRLLNDMDPPKQMNRVNEKNKIEQLKEKLLRWKAEKEETLNHEKEQEQEKLLEKMKKEKLERQKQIERRKIVEEWKQSKILYAKIQMEHKKINEEIEKKRRAVVANKLIKQYQSMDELHIIKMRQLHQKSLENSPEKPLHSATSITRDPNRVLQPTIQWAHRVRAIKEPGNELTLLSKIPKLAVPDWRKNI